ncbi:hypothetical protein CYY_004488 [Polysphondylium violaceum]|uniref:Phosphatidylinositol transfer protein N-terminal domain-containing protein n=1 Tax=Polysphondylium violaceum TaxID=133409 RepID=A0A8J4PWJ5_9MYCE|nr:hypothetical protein CYY_004488 [Polysphondylium violaceum]
MLIKEYRIHLPFTVDEYHQGQVYMTARKSNESSRSGENVEVLAREAYTDERGYQGVYTHKLFLLNRSLPRFASAILPKSALKIEEKSWNCFPHTKTLYSCPFFGEKFYLCIESMHKNGNQEEENVFNLPKDVLKKRIIDNIDIAFDPIDTKDYKMDEDPKYFKSSLTNRGPLDEKGWHKKQDPSMICYKLVSVNFNYWGFQHKVEQLVQNNGLRDLFLKAHRSMFCWLDEWYGLSEIELLDYEQRIFKHSRDSSQNICDNCQKEIDAPPVQRSNFCNHDENSNDKKMLNDQLHVMN